MVEELKLAIKVDDDSIEQSLLKQFANAQKMADKVVLDFKNVNFDDKEIEAKFKALQKKAGQNPIDLSVSKDTIQMLSQISDKLGDIFKIAQGKSIIDSSSTIKEIDKINKSLNKTSEILNKSFSTKNKTEAFNQLKEASVAYEKFYGNEKAMATQEGAQAAYNYYKAYEEALKKGVAQTRLEKVTIDVEKGYNFNSSDLSSRRIKEFENYQKYGGDLSDLSLEIASLDGKLKDFSSAYAEVKKNLGEAPITPEIISNIEHYVELLDKVRYLKSWNKSDDKDIIAQDESSAKYFLDSAIYKAQEQNYNYTDSLKTQEIQAIATAEAEKKLAETQKEVSFTSSETNISLGDSSAVDTQNKLQEELKETQIQAEKTAQAVLKVTGYRGTNGGDPVTSNKSGATFWDSKKNVAKMYGTDSSDKTLWSSDLSFYNPFTFDAKKQKYGDITYLGDGADKASEAIIELTQRENALRKALDNSTKSGLEEVKMAYELQDVCQRITKISKDTSNPYGTHSTDWFAEYAKNNGYDGVAIKNVLDTPDSYAKNGTEVSDVYITFQREQLQNTTLLAKANHELAESEREVALAELGVTQNKTISSNNSLEDKIKSIFTDAKELKQILESLYNGKYFSFDTSENDDALGRVRELQKILKDYGYKIKNFKDDSEAFCVSGVISSLEEENNVLDKNTKKIKENQQMRSQNQTKDAFQVDNSSTTNASTSAIKEENNALEQTAQSAEKAANSKKKFAKANQEVKDSANASVGAIKDENNAFDKNKWDKNVKAIQKYMDAVTELNHLKAKDKGTGKNASVIADQEQEVERLKNIAYEAKKTLSSIANSNKADVNTWEKWVNVMKQFDQASQGSTRSIARLEDAMRNANNSQIEYMNSVIKRFQNSYDKYSTDASRNGYNPSVEFSDKLSSFNSSLNDLKNLSSSISNGEFVKQEQIDSFKRLTQNAEEAQKALKNMSASEKGMKSVSVQKEIDKINQLLRENTRYSKEAKIELRSLITQLMSGDPTANLEAIHTKVMEIKNAEELAGRAGKNFFDILASKSYYGFIGQMQSYLSMYVGFYGMMNSFRNGLSTVRELNTALTEMRKVSEETTQSLKNYQNTTFDVANAVGTTAKQIQTSTADYMRLGESLDVAAESAKTANVLLNVSEFDNIEDATKSLVAMGQAYKDLDKMTIVDKLNEVGKIVAQTYSNVWCYKNIAW